MKFVARPSPLMLMKTTLPSSHLVFFASETSPVCLERSAPPRGSVPAAALARAGPVPFVGRYSSFHCRPVCRNKVLEPSAVVEKAIQGSLGPDHRRFSEKREERRRFSPPGPTICRARRDAHADVCAVAPSAAIQLAVRAQVFKARYR